MNKPADNPQAKLAAGAENDKNAQPKAKPVKEKKPKAKPANDEVELPMLIEIGYTFAGILLVAVAVIVAAVSMVSGASLVQIFLRTLVTVVVMGVVLWLFTWQFSTGVLEGAMRSMEEDELKKKQDQADKRQAAEDAKNELEQEMVREA